MTRSTGSKGKFQPIAHILLAAAIGVGLGAGASFAQSQQTRPAQVAQAKGKPAAEPAHGHPGERHPALHRALRDLERAKVALEKAPASDNVDGHKEAALKLVGQAIDEINAGLFPKK